MENETKIDLFGFNGWKKFGNEKTNTYEEFKDKFKPKLTTDDCYTPKAVMDVVNDFVRNDLGVGDRPFVRPFMPGGDFENFDYPKNCVVVDNPPFSIFSKINRWYIERGIDFFLFGPHLTLFNSYDATFVVCGAEVIYAMVRMYVQALQPRFVPTAAFGLRTDCGNASRKRRSVTNKKSARFSTQMK